MRSRIALSCLLGLMLVLLSQALAHSASVEAENGILIGGPTSKSPASLLAMAGAERPAFDVVQNENGGGLGAPLPLTVCPPISLTRDWYSEPVDHPNLGAISRRGFQFDRNDQPHIVYVGEQHLSYAWYDGTGWYSMTVQDSAGGDAPSLVLDDTGLPHISYAQDGSLKYAHWTGSGWSVQTVDTEGVESPSSLALDGAGDAHISYYINGGETLDGYPFAVKYAMQSGTGWDVQVIEQGVSTHTNLTVFGTSLALDTSGLPHISYALNPPTPPTVKYASWTGSNWDIQVVEQYDDTIPTMFSSPHLVLDTVDHPHIIYHRRVGGALFSIWVEYASKSNGAWDIQEVAPGPVVFSSILSVDASGGLHLSYSEVALGALYYARWTGTSWDQQNVTDPAYSSYYFPLALTLDTCGNPRIVYYNSYTEELFYAWQLPPLSLTKTATPADDLTINDTLTFTLALSGAGRTVKLWDPLPMNVDYVPGSGTSIIPPAPVYSPTARAIAWQGVISDSGQIIRFQVTPKEFVGTGSLSLPIVNTAWVTDTAYGRSASSTVIVNGRHVYLPLVTR